MGDEGFRIGIDFGTSNTAAVLAFPDGRVRPLLFDGSPLLPSAVHADPLVGLLVGRDATHAARVRPDRFEPHPKRCVDDGAVLLGEARVPVTDLIAGVLRRVAAEASRVAGGAVPRAVLTCPAGWGARRQEVLGSAARDVFADVVLVPEPVAAATYFVAVAGRRVPTGSCLMVYDLGAGTFDASVVRRTGEGFEVLAIRGLDDVGGLDIDAEIVATLGHTYRARDEDTWRRLVEPQDQSDRRASRTLWEDVRAGKELLSRAAHTSVHIPLFDDEAPVGREQLDRLATPILARTVAASRAVLDAAGVAPEELAGLFLVGGASRMPLAAALLHKQLGIAPTVVEQPELVVAEGGLHTRAPAAAPAGPDRIGVPPPVLPTPSPSPPVPADDRHRDAGPGTRFRLRLRRRLTAVALAATVLAGAGAAVIAEQLSDPPSNDLIAVPEPLREDCRGGDDATMPGAARTLLCRDRQGQQATVGLFTDREAVESAYRQAVREAGVTPGEGDCATAATGEHRYPAAGTATGRVLCYTGAAGRTSIVWTDDQGHTITRAEAASQDAGRTLREAWLAWTAAPAFPTREERDLIDLLAAVDCRRAPVGVLDDFPGALAGVECNPQGVGARTASYFRFGTVAELRSAMDGQAAAVKAPTGTDCADGTAPGFLGTRRYDLRSVELGALLCHPGPQSSLVLQWSVESLLVAGRAVGADATGLAAWWRVYSGPPVARTVEAVNGQAAPPFPTAAESELLTHIPQRSRTNCIRPSGEQIRKNVGSEPVVAIVCGPTSGARVVFYYRFPDLAAMRRSYGSGRTGGADCTKQPRSFAGESSYQRGRVSGRLRCGSDESGNRWLEWTTDELAIASFAFQGGDPAAMIDWWRHDAGPA
ncbi:Hsp70 family protein [Plantactinospora soyae]|uniref:Hsp70 family protein n=1 Tax=Plantactinospora soyae TaxID=1544732 RepID=A0A927R341_9ACTN|nr:Hsp70 family protein [Plantactinospora soyae]MBE1491443.1 hypothetical protein [Plantactinospora soyae]